MKDLNAVTYYVALAFFSPQQIPVGWANSKGEQIKKKK